MSTYNLDRGQELYYAELKSFCAKNPNLSEDIMSLGSMFNKVGVMQEGTLTTSTWSESSFTYDFVPSYKRLANLVANAAFLKSKSEEDIHISDMVHLVFENWDNRLLPINEIPKDKIKYLPVIAAKTEEEIVNDSSYQEILANSEEMFNLVENDELTAYDDIDLLEDLAEYLDDDDEAFTDEGKRALGLLSEDHDSTDSVLYGADGEPVKTFKSTYKTGECYVDENGEYVITCPYTGSKNVYQISTNLFASYETDEPFKVKLSLADTAE